MRRRILLLIPCLLANSSCLTITIRGTLQPTGTLLRSIQVDAASHQPIDAAKRRFAPPWKVTEADDRKSMTASIELPHEEEIPKNETDLSWSVTRHFLYTAYLYHEDYSKLRLGERPPPIAPIPPRPLLLWPTILAHERNLSVIERRARESVKMRLLLKMPGRVVDGNFDRREDDRLIWDFNLRAPSAPRAESRIYRFGRIGAMAFGGLLLIAAAALSLRKHRKGLD